MITRSRATPSVAATIGNEFSVYTIDALHPVACAVDSGDVVVFETSDKTYQRLSNGESFSDIGIDNCNAVTGPLFVRGCQPGDALRIDIIDIEITRAWSVFECDYGPFADKTKRSQIKSLEICRPPVTKGRRKGSTNGVASPRGPLRLKVSERLCLPLEPMIGCIATAPPMGEAGKTYEPAYSYGGNMDLKEAMAGATIWLPVNVEGGLLFIGDLHANMGQGEPVWVGLESAGRVTVRVTVDKHPHLANLPFPRLQVAGTDGPTTLLVGMGKSMEAAQDVALKRAWEFITKEKGLTNEEAFAFCSARIGYRWGGPAHNIVLAEVPYFDLETEDAPEPETPPGE